MATPQTNIYICNNLRLNNKYEHSIYFASASAQQSYFSGKTVKSFTAYSYVRKSWTLKVDATMEQARTWSYLYFRNGSGKYYYYFINNIEYINEFTVELSLEIDVIQTYMFDYSLLRCFVEREHATSDNIGENTLPENLELGEFIVNNKTNYNLSSLAILVQSTFNPLTTSKDATDTVLASRYDGIFSGLGIYAVSMDNWSAWGTKLKQLSEAGKIDGIVNMWMYPKSLIQLADGETWSDGNVCHKVAGTTPDSFVIDNIDKLDTYTPKNKKLFTYPYNFIYMTNNDGNSAIYHYEKFGIEGNKFNVTGTVGADASVRIYPIYYKSTPLNYDEGLSLGNFPTCAWNADAFKIWLAQNQSSLTLSAGVGALSIATGTASAILGGPLGFAIGGGSITGGAQQVASVLASVKDASVQPPQARGKASTSINVKNSTHTFTYYQKSVDRYHARIIDDYFTMYGYQTNRVKVPSIAGRKAFNYVKTIDCHITGNLCTEDLTKIENIYNNGITFWKNGDNIGDYSVDNTL